MRLLSIIYNNLMFIGYSPTCKGFCLQQSKGQYEKRLHTARQPHSIIPLKSFKTECKDYILDIQKTWGDFDKSIQSFFSKLRTDLDTIQKKMLMKRLPQQQLRTAVNSKDEKLIDLSRKVFNEKYDKLTCEEISRFIKIKEGQEKSGEYLNIGKREEDLAYDLMDEIKQVVYSLGKELLINRKRAKEEKGDEKIKNKREDHRDERVYTRKQTTTTFQRRQGRGNCKGRRQQHRERRQQQIQTNQQQERRRMPNRGTRDDKESDYRRERRQQRPWKKDRQASDISTKKTQKLRIVDLDKNSTDFSIELKIEGFIKALKEDEVWRARDETGEIKLLIPHLPQLAKGSQVTITNCFIREHGTELELRVRRDSEISIEGIKQKISAADLYNNTNKRQRRERTFQSQSYPKFTKINDLTPNLQAVKMIAKVISAKKMDKVIQCVLGDETGTINAKFQVGAELLKQKSSIYFRGLQTEVEQDPKTNEGGLIIIGGKRLLIELAREPVGNVKFSNNVSDRKYKAVEDEDNEW